MGKNNPRTKAEHLKGCVRFIEKAAKDGYTVYRGGDVGEPWCEEITLYGKDVELGANKSIQRS